MEQIRNFDQLLQAALAHGRKGIAVAAPYDKNTLLAVKDALACPCWSRCSWTPER